MQGIIQAEGLFEHNIKPSQSINIISPGSNSRPFSLYSYYTAHRLHFEIVCVP